MIVPVFVLMVAATVLGLAVYAGLVLLETLEVYLGAGQNIREAARRLHLAPRTVAYRLERIETLLGRELDGDVAMRLGAALLALRVNRQATGEPT